MRPPWLVSSRDVSVPGASLRVTELRLSDDAKARLDIGSKRRPTVRAVLAIGLGVVLWLGVDWPRRTIERHWPAVLRWVRGER